MGQAATVLSVQENHTILFIVVKQQLLLFPPSSEQTVSQVSYYTSVNYTHTVPYIIIICSKLLRQP